MKETKTVGRPPKYESEEKKLEVRRMQNKLNQQRCRRRKKLLNEIEIFSNNDTRESYRSTLVNYLNQFNFDFSFTGTIDPNRIEREKLALINEDIKQLNKEFNLELSLTNPKRIGINALKNYTDKYITHLFDKHLISRCFVAFEQDVNKQYHVHILFKSNAKALNFRILSENKWLLGIATSRVIESSEAKLKAIKYMVKQMNCHAKRKSDLHKIDSWFCEGDYVNSEDVIIASN